MQQKKGMDAYEAGFSGFVNGDLENPFHPKSYAAKEWERGFNRAYFANLGVELPKRRSNRPVNVMNAAQRLARRFNSGHTAA